MAPIKFLIALSSLAVLSCILGATPTNALSIDHQHVNRHVVHNSIAKKKRGSQSGRCKNKPASSTPSPNSDNNAVAISASSSSSSSTSSSSPAYSPASTPASGSGSGGGKAGAAWALGPDPRLKLVKTDNSKFLYTWSPTIPQQAFDLGFTVMIQLWGDDQINDFKNAAKPGYAGFAMGFNEPNEPKQSNMDPGWAATVWQENLEPLRSQGYQLCSPATSSDPNGMTWMNNFLAACNGKCNFDYTCTHFYDTTFEKLQTYLELWHNTFGKPVFLTEFACQNYNGGPQPSDGDIWEFYTQALTWMDQTDWIVSYFAFGLLDSLPDGVNPADELFDGDSLSALGNLIWN